MDAQNLSAIVGMLCLIISYLVVKPLKQSLDDVKAGLAEMRVALTAIINDTSSMRSEIELCKRDLKSAFRYIDEMRADIAKLKDKQAQSK